MKFYASVGRHRFERSARSVTLNGREVASQPSRALVSLTATLGGLIGIVLCVGCLPLYCALWLSGIKDVPAGSDFTPGLFGLLVAWGIWVSLLAVIL